MRPHVVTLLVTLATLMPWHLVSSPRAKENAARAAEPDRTVLPITDRGFQGVADRTLGGSKPDYPTPVKAPEGAPNVVLILLDDAGFGNPSTFGGPVQTPTFEKLASNGLRYNRFHVTGLCSPTRAALLSGRNHHTMGFGSVAELVGGYPGYSGRWPKSAASIARVLRDNGYATSAFGKWHLTPDHSTGPAGPFDRWPNALGFEYFWGFLGAESSQYDTLLTENNTILGVPNDEDFYFPDAMAERAVHWLEAQRSQSPEKPFFLYFAPGATHAPHHVPKAWADRYAGKFDQGWDKLREETFARQKQRGVIPADARLTPRDPAFPAWDSLPPEQRKIYARQMEVFAGFLENADYQIGRVMNAIEELGQLDNTLVLYIFGDNGASMEGTPTGTFNEIVSLLGVPLTPEQQLRLISLHGGIKEMGGPKTDPHYASAWAWAGNTPFPWGKQLASHLGGIRSPMVVSWPKQIKDKGSVRSQFTHVIDVAPTILEVAGLPAARQVDGVQQIPLQGVSFANSFLDGDAKSRHTSQYFAILGNRSMYKDGWLLSARLPKLPWDMTPPTMARFAPGAWDPDKDPVELFNLDADFSQSEDVAAKYPEKVKELRELFWEEAAKNNVLPLLAEYSYYYGMLPPETGQSRYVYRAGMDNLPPGSIPHMNGRSYTLSAKFDMPESGADGVIIANGSFLGGYAMYVEGGKLKHTYNFYGLRADTLTAADKLPAGKINARFEFIADEPGKRATGGKTALYVNDAKVAEGRLEHTVVFRFSLYEGMDIGRDNGLPVTSSYAKQSPFAFPAEIEQVELELK
ncbi:MAG TPA: arylsulfatase [Pirellulales bacterium]|nr:arylsulfatase [Pirellulales bacterium]